MGPIWQSGGHGERKLLCRSSLELTLASMFMAEDALAPAAAPADLDEALSKLDESCSFSHVDIIVEYFITQRNYNIFEINKALFAFDRSLQGG